MGESEATVTIQIIVIGMVALFVLSLAVIIFFIIYQKRLFIQQKKHQEMAAAYQKELLSVAIQSEEKERSRIGKELHDNVGALLTTTKLYLSQISPDVTPEKLTKTTDKMYSLFDTMIQGIRNISQDLRPVILERLGLIEAVAHLVQTIHDTETIKAVFIDQTSNITIKNSELNIYRIIQELINNTIKHAKASELLITFKNDQTNLVITYQDNGVGFKHGELKEKNGIGLKNIESRLSVLSGNFKFDTIKKGMKLTIKIPLKP